MLHNLVWVLTGINLIIKAPNVLVVESLICEVQSLNKPFISINNAGSSAIKDS
jgi:hypothetical protein